MPSVTIDASVVDGSNTLPFPNPISLLNSPINIGSKLIGGISSPINISSQFINDIYTPTSIDSELIGGIGLPSSIGSLSVGGIDTPTSIDSEPVIGIINPVSIAPETEIDLSLAVSITPESPASPTVPVNITAEAEAELSAPSSYTPNAIETELPPFALNHARILYDNLLVGSASSTDSGTNPSFALIPNTAQRWTTSVNSFLKFTLPVNQNIDTVCIGAHNLSAGGYTVGVFYRATVGGTLTAFTTGKTPTNDNALMFHRSSTVSAKTIEVYLTGGTGDAFIGSVYAGVALQMQRPFFGGHTPAVLARQADYYSSMSESGNFIGVEVRRRALESDAAWKNLTDTWYRQYFVPFLASAEVLPFYFAWNLLEYPTDVAYCKNITNVAPSYSGQRDLMTVGIPLVGIA